MKKSKQSSNDILAGGSIRRLFTVPMIICLVVFAIILITTTFLSVDFLGYSYSGEAYDLISMLKQEVKSHDPYYCLSASYFSYSTMAFFGLIFAAIQFNFLLNKKSCYTQLSFAVDRRQLFFNKTFFPILIAISLVVAINIIVGILNVAYLGLKPNLVFAVILNILSFIVPFLLNYAVVIAGHLFAARHVEAYLFILAILNSVDAIRCMADYIFNSTLYGYYGYYGVTSFVSSTYDVSSFSVSSEESYLPDIAMAIVFIVIITVAFILLKQYFIKRYKAEQCGVRAKSRVALVITCTIIPLLLVHSYSSFSLYFYESDIIPFGISITISIIITVILALIACLLATFSPKKLGWGGLAAGITVALHLITILIGYTGGLGFTTSIPEPEKIKTVNISLPFDDLIYTDYGNDYFNSTYYTETLTVTDKEEIEIVRNIHKALIDDRQEETGISIEIYYETTNGSVMRKYNNISLSAAEEMLNLWKTTEANDTLKVLLNQATKQEIIQKYKDVLGDEFEDFKMDEFYEDISSNVAANYYDEFGEYYDDYSEYLYDILPTPLKATDLTVISKDLQETTLNTQKDDGTPYISQEAILEIMSAIYKDACELSAEEWFKPENQLGALGFDKTKSYSRSEENTLIMYGGVFYVNSDMTNTINALKKHDLYKYLDCQKEIEKAHLADVNEVANWIQYNEYYETEAHNTYFSQSNPDIGEYLTNCCGYSGSNSTTDYSDDWEDDYYYSDEYFEYGMLGRFFQEETETPTVNFEDIEPQEAEALLKDAYLAYNVGNNGKFLVIKYTDGSCSMLVVPE